MLMIRVATRNKDILIIDISKHVTNINQKDKQYELICAGISAISIGLANAIEEICPGQCEYDINENPNVDSSSNHVIIKVKQNDAKLQTILNTGLCQLKTVCESYPNYIDLKITEV